MNGEAQKYSGPDLLDTSALCSQISSTVQSIHQIETAIKQLTVRISNEHDMSKRGALFKQKFKKEEKNRSLQQLLQQKQTLLDKTQKENKQRQEAYAEEIKYMNSVDGLTKRKQDILKELNHTEQELKEAVVDDVDDDEVGILQVRFQYLKEQQNRCQNALERLERAEECNEFCRKCCHEFCGKCLWIFCIPIVGLITFVILNVSGAYGAW